MVLITHRLVAYILSLNLFLTLAHAEEPTSDTYRTNKGPLTTQFVPPSTCLNEVKTRVLYELPRLELGCEGPGGNECCPPHWGWNRYFSPGVCPSGYQTCDLPSSRQRQETTKLCCPADFDCATHVDKDCTSMLNTPVTTVATVSGTTTSMTMPLVWATNIQIRYQASDSSVVPVPTDDSLPPIDDGSLSASEKGGIAVGVILGVLALGGTGYFLGRRHVRQKLAYNDINLQHTPSDPPPAYPGKE